MASKLTLLVFLAGIVAAAVTAGTVADLSFTKAATFFLSMLMGGSIYFLMKARS
jgi:hypothetical protein